MERVSVTKGIIEGSNMELVFRSGAGDIWYDMHPVLTKPMYFVGCAGWFRTYAEASAALDGG